ncbi:MAG: hypothetical protein WKF58_11980 [Ilumatobacteraceae bacterium]
MVETTDVVFAVDSVPAIFGVSRDPFIVFSSNAFAILGLRAPLLPPRWDAGQAPLLALRAGRDPRVRRRQDAAHVLSRAVRVAIGGLPLPDVPLARHHRPHPCRDGVRIACG